MHKPEIRFGKDHIRYCHFCENWDADVYKWDLHGRKILVHEGKGCLLGAGDADNCPLTKEEDILPLRPKYAICNGCPYGVGKPCIGWCIAKLLGQMEGDPDVI